MLVLWRQPHRLLQVIAKQMRRPDNETNPSGTDGKRSEWPGHDRCDFVRMMTSFLWEFFGSPERHKIRAKSIERGEERGSNRNDSDYTKVQAMCFAARGFLQHGKNIVLAPEASQ